MKPIKLLFVMPFLAACSTSGAGHVPVIDGQLGPNYSNDLAQCQQLARSQPVVDGDRQPPPPF